MLQTLVSRRLNSSLVQRLLFGLFLLAFFRRLKHGAQDDESTKKRSILFNENEQRLPRSKSDLHKLFAEDVSQEYLDKFYRYKENQYQERRNLIKRVCRGLNPYELKRAQTLTSSLIFMIDGPPKTTACLMPKVASTKWKFHFNMLYAKLASAAQKKRDLANHGDKTFNELHGVPWNIEKRRSFLKASEANSVVFVRHPLDKLASFYFNKLVKLENGRWNLTEDGNLTWIEAKQGAERYAT